MWKTLRVLDFYSLPLGVPSLGECPKDKGGAASGEETDEGTTFPVDAGFGEAECLPRITEMSYSLC